jgi:hypothetical protein
MFDVDHKVARLDIGKEDLRRDRTLGLASPRLRLAPAEEFGVGVEMKIGDTGLGMGIGESAEVADFPFPNP